MMASEKTAVGPDLPKTFMIKTRCCGLSGAGKAKTSDMSAAGSESARGPEKWSDMVGWFLMNLISRSSGWRSRSPFDRCKSRGHHQAVMLVDQEACFVGELEVRLPFRIRRHRGALACPIARVIERPQVHECVDVSALTMQIGEGRPKMPDLCSEAVLRIEIKLLGHLARLNSIGA